MAQEKVTRSFIVSKKDMPTIYETIEVHDKKCDYYNDKIIEIRDKAIALMKEKNDTSEKFWDKMRETFEVGEDYGLKFREIDNTGQYLIEEYKKEDVAIDAIGDAIEEILEKKFGGRAEFMGAMKMRVPGTSKCDDCEKRDDCPVADLDDCEK